MQAESSWHIAEELLDLYSLGRLRDEQVPQIEEHLIVCAECQVRLTDVDEFSRVMTTAVAELDYKAATCPSTFWKRLSGMFGMVPKPLWAGGLAIAITLVFLRTPPRDTHGHGPAVELTTSRGANGSLAHVAAGSNIVLHIDATKIGATPSCWIQLVRSNGEEILRTSATVRTNQIATLVPRRLNPGRYWVRVYSGTDSSKLLQEYGLDVI